MAFAPQVEELRRDLRIKSQELEVKNAAANDKLKKMVKDQQEAEKKKVLFLVRETVACVGRTPPSLGFVCGVGARAAWAVLSGVSFSQLAARTPGLSRPLSAGHEPRHPGAAA